MKKIKAKLHKRSKAPRSKKIVFALNEKENEALTLYCQKYKIKNRSEWIRHLLMSSVLKRFDEDYPTLF